MKAIVRFFLVLILATTCLSSDTTSWSIRIQNVGSQEHRSVTTLLPSSVSYGTNIRMPRFWVSLRFSDGKSNPVNSWMASDGRWAIWNKGACFCSLFYFSPILVYTYQTYIAGTNNCYIHIFYFVKFLKSWQGSDMCHSMKSEGGGRKRSLKDDVWRLNDDRQCYFFSLMWQVSVLCHSIKSEGGGRKRGLKFEGWSLRDEVGCLKLLSLPLLCKEFTCVMMNFTWMKFIKGSCQTIFNHCFLGFISLWRYCCNHLFNSFLIFRGQRYENKTNLSHFYCIFSFQKYDGWQAVVILQRRWICWKLPLGYVFPLSDLPK